MRPRPIFFSRLKKQAEHCNFGSLFDDMLRDRMVLGCLSMEARKRLLQTESLTLKMVKDTIRMFEAVENARVNVLQPDTPIDSVRVAHQYKSQSAPFASKPLVSADGKPCSRCGKPRLGKRQCVAFEKKCTNCGKLNPFHSVCGSSKTCNHVDDNVMHVETFPENHSSERLLF